MKNLKLNSVRCFVLSLTAFCLFNLASAQASDGHDRNVRVVNNTSEILRNFYASTVDTEVWEDDILGRKVLLPGYEVNVNVDDGSGYCLYDFKAVFSDGTKVVRHRVNVCTITSWTIY